ncbi:MAG: PAS domain-containing protein [Pseudolabrys sp.]
MSGIEFQFWLKDSRLAAHALSPSPVWLWNTDGSRILWANPNAAAIFDAASPGAAAALEFEPQNISATQIVRLAGTLPQGGAPRLERLRGLGASFGGTLMCLCSRVTLADNRAAILVVSTERAGKDLSLPERARRLLSDIERPAAIFSADGELIEASAAASQRFGNARDLNTLGAENLAREASRNGQAEGDIPSGHIAMLRLGGGATVALLAILEPAQNASHAGARASEAARNIATSIAQSRADSETGPRATASRFVWQMDAANRFTLGIDELTGLLGANTGAVLNRTWGEIAQALKLDSDGRVAQALAARETWSGIAVRWPVDGSNERVTIEMSGLPVFDRDRKFEGYRGFGICRDTRVTEIERPAPPVEPAPPKVVAFSPPQEPEPSPAPALTTSEHVAFEELARELNARLKKSVGKDTAGQTPDDFDVEPFVEQLPPSAPPPKPEQPKAARNGDAVRDTQEGRPILDRIPVGVLVYRLNNLIYANRAFLDWTGYANLEALTEAGGLDSLFIDTKTTDAPEKSGKNGGKTLTITTVNGKQRPVEGRLFPVAWNGESALVLMINTQAASDDLAKAVQASLLQAENENLELHAILNTATDGVLVLDSAGRVLSANSSAQALFGYEVSDFTEMTFGDLFAPESRRSVLDYLDKLARGAPADLLDAGREAIGRVRRGGLVPLYLTMGRMENGEKFCAVLRDITSWKRTEEELINARQQAERASTAKSEFLAKISHEIRTPLNAIIGFSEVMIEERFGAIGNERYAQYLKDIHSSGGHLISLLNDLLDLSKIEAGKLDLSFVSVNLNDLVQQCVAIMQQQANKERVIIRTSLPANLPQIVADARSVRQIMLNLLSNSIKFTGAGGQVIVSTFMTDGHEVGLRVRDTGVGMSEKELQTALEPFRQLATSARWGSSGTGLGLPITKALAEANHARFSITSQVDDGTLVEVAFPATRVLAE